MPSAISEQKVTTETCRAERRKNTLFKMIPRLDGGLDWAYLEPVWLSWKHHGAPAVFWICSLRMRMLCRCSGGNMAICSGVSCRTCIMRAAWRTHTEKENFTPHTPTHPHTHRRIKHLKLQSKVCFSGSHVSQVLSWLHNKGNKRWLQKGFSVSTGYCFFTRPFLYTLATSQEMLCRMTFSMTFCVV